MCSAEQGPGVVVQEHSAGIEFAADLEESVQFRVEAFQAAAGHEVDLPPVRPGLEFLEHAALVRRLLGPIFDYEQSQDGDLTRTLRTYLDSQRSWQKTAAALFAHRQTIIYRIRKIGELTGLDMGETSTVAQLWFALQIHEAMHQ